jgi:hypothetical protein
VAGGYVRARVRNSARAFVWSMGGALRGHGETGTAVYNGRQAVRSLLEGASSAKGADEMIAQVPALSRSSIA